MAVQPAYLDEKMKELENDKESLRLQVIFLSKPKETFQGWVKIHLKYIPVRH